MKNKQFYDDMYDPTNVNYGDYQTHNQEQYTDRENRLRERTSNLIELFSVEASQILEIGASTGGTGLLTANWTGLEYSSVAVSLAKRRFGERLNIIQGDAQSMPLPNSSFDFVYSWATLEHVENPDLAFKEIDRVTRCSGIVCIKPAWNCRKWRVQKIDKIPYNRLRANERLIKAFLPIIENIFIRSLFKIPARTFKLVISIGKKDVDFNSRKLEPSFSLIEKYGHDADDDAFSSFDIVDAIIFFQSRNYEIISHSTIWSKIFARGDILTVRKTQ